MIGDLLYELMPKDALGSPALELILRRQTVSQAIIDPSVTIYTVPRDRILLILGVNVQATPGAAQNVTFVRWEIIEVDATTERFLQRERFAGANVTEHLNSLPYALPVPSGARIDAKGEFSAGGAANTVTGRLAGWLVPRGTLQVG